ncbi:Cell shape-determining protein MreC [compost metagenome]
MIGLVLTLPLISINMQQGPQESHWLSKPFSLLGSSISEIFYGFSHGVKSTTAMYLDLVNIKKESEDIHSRNNELTSRLEKMNELQLENDRLRELMAFKQESKMHLTAAQMIGRDLVLDHNTITINKGINDGIKAGQAVITTGGVLGYIYKPETFTSHVMLITDRYSVVDGVVQRTRAHGIVEGKSQNSSTLNLKYVEKTEDVQEGDIIVTGGLDNIFPKGFPIAVVEAVERKTFSVSLKVDLRPIVDPYKVEEVFVVTNAANEDLSAKFTSSTVEPTPTNKVVPVPGATPIPKPAVPAVTPTPPPAPPIAAPATPVVKPSPTASPSPSPAEPQENN